MRASRSFLESLDLPPGDLNALPESAKRFADGARYRVEIPSCEGPRCLEALLETAARLDVRVHRVSQGSGVFMLTDAELAEMAAMARAANVEVSLFARPNAAWDTSAMARSPAGGAVAAASRGQEQIVQGLADARRAAAGRRAQRADRRRRPARRVRRGAPPRLPAGGHAGQDLGDAARLQPGDGAGARGAGRGHAQPHDRPLAGADRGDPRGRRRAARHLRRGARQRRRLRAAARDSRDRARRGARVPQVRPAQRARRVSRGHAPRGDDRRAHARARAARAARPGAARARVARLRDVRARRRAGSRSCNAGA